MGQRRISGITLALVTVAGLIGLATPAQAAPCGDGDLDQRLFDPDGWKWDLEADGSVDDGIGDAFDGYPDIEVGGSSYPSATPDACLLEEGGREVVYPEETLSGLEVSRKVYVPAGGLAFARFLTVIRNGGGAAVDTTYTVTGNLGSDSATKVQLTSSGDSLATPADRWATSDESFSDADASDPALIHVWDGALPGAPQTVSAVDFVDGDDSPVFDYSISVPPGGTFVFLHVIAQRTNIGFANAVAPGLGEGPPDVFVGLSPAELGQLRNWVLPTCRGNAVTLFGTSGGDSLTATTGVDVVLAGDGDDVVSTLGGNDIVCAGAGNDRVNGGGGKDQIAGEDGIDKLKGAGGNDLLLGGPDNDVLNGGPGKRDVCKGGPGKDKAKACERGKA